MDDFRLKVFIAAARTLSFTRAAEQLYISQPAVSKHVGELESRYKVQLFTRRGSRLELTDAGRTMLEAAGRLLDDYRRLEYEMSLCADQTGGELRLGASTTIAQYLLPPILAHFTARFPGVRVSMSSGNSAEVEQADALLECLARRKDQHRHQLLARSQAPQHFTAVKSRKAEVEDGQIKSFAFEPAQPGQSIAGDLNLIAGLA